MKLNKFFFGLLTIPALALTACSDYGDVDTFSPEADAEATGAFFSKSTSSNTLVPGKTSFEVVLNRAVSGSAASIPVTVTKNDKDFFSLSASSFSFDAESQISAPITVSFDETACTFQEPDTLSLQVLGGEKDHIYAAGYASTTVFMVVDYQWVDSLQVMLTNTYVSDEASLTTVQIAKNFETEAEPATQKQTLLQVPGLVGDANVQFVVDANHANPAEIGTYFTDNGIALKVRTELGTGMILTLSDEAKTELPVFMDVTNLAASDVSASKAAYTITYDLYAKDEKTGKTYKVEKDAETVEEGKSSYTATFTAEFPTEEKEPQTTE